MQLWLFLYGQITTNKPVKVKSNADGKTRFDFEMKLDIQKNKPVILKKQETSSSETGTECEHSFRW